MKTLSLALIAVLAQTLPAAGEPCAVTIVRAPDEVRAAVEKWVAAETSCRSTSLELRALATDDGIYLMARDDRGRVFERTVPDAQSAGVLVASWIADDAVGVPGPAPVAAPAPAPVAAPPPPSVVAVVEAPREQPWLAPPSGKWLTAAVMTRISDSNREGYGGRFALDLVEVGPWRFGGAFEMSKIESPSFADEGKLVDTRLMATVSRTLSHGRWLARLEVGAGAARVTVDSPAGHATGVFPVAEASLLLGLRGDQWAVGLGPVLSWSKQRLTQDMYVEDEGYLYETNLMSRDGDAMLMVGLQHRL